MNRRHLLLGSGVALSSVLAGCTGGEDDNEGNGEDNDENDENGNGEGESTEPLYEEGDREDLLLEIGDFPEGWTRDDEFNDNFDQVFLNDDETIIVFASVEVGEDIETAQGRFEDAKSGTRDPQDYNIGDEAFWDTRNDEVAITLFRHSNAIGQVVAMRESGMEVVPDQSRSQNYAGAMFEHWEEL